MHLKPILLSLTLTLTLQTTASPIPMRLPFPHFHSKQATTLTESQITTIAPKSTSCTDAPAKDECATAKEAAKYTSQSFETYSITSKPEQAAILSLITFESDDFKYNKNHFPGVAGQGSEYQHLQHTPDGNM
jgi:hypothetical protein